MIQPFPHEELPTSFSPSKPYWVYQEETGRWLRFQSLTEFVGWQGDFQTVAWDWIRCTDLSNYVNKDDPERYPCDDVAEALLAQGATGMLTVIMAGTVYYFDLDDTANHPSFDAFAHRALCDMYTVRRSAPGAKVDIDLGQDLEEISDESLRLECLAAYEDNDCCVANFECPSCFHETALRNVLLAEEGYYYCLSCETAFKATN